MTDKWKNRLLLRGEFGWGFLMAAVCFVPPLLMAISFLPREMDISNKWRAAYESCDAQRSELTSAATVLYEFEAAKGIELLGGAVTLQPGPALGGPALLGGKQEPRWFLPARVKPVVYGDGTGRAYAWVNTQTRTVEGPFAPEVQP